MGRVIYGERRQSFEERPHTAAERAAFAAGVLHITERRNRPPERSDSSYYPRIVGGRALLGAVEIR
ncbi:hypothetical protein CYG49_02260 [Candidatus Saccharibacteria bacterium]|nr:MAG: hypothetical protein CYG49_02260 [Candidatus Saccharibacteria bacterium]